MNSLPNARHNYGRNCAISSGGNLTPRTAASIAPLSQRNGGMYSRRRSSFARTFPTEAICSQRGGFGLVQAARIQAFTAISKMCAGSSLRSIASVTTFDYRSRDRGIRTFGELFVSQSDHRVDPHCAPGGNDAGQSCDAVQHQGGDGKREGIERLHAVEKLLDKACQAPRSK